MTYLTALRRGFIVLAFTFLFASIAGAETADGLRKKLATASASIKDLKGTMVVTPANKSEAGEISKGILEFLDYGFREAKIYYKRPDKFRADGKAKGVDVTYILVGNKKRIVASSIMLKKTEDLSKNLARKQSTLDIGFASDSLWTNNNVKLVSVSKGVAKLQLIPKGTKDKRKELIWIEVKTLKLTKRERYTGEGKLRTRHVYSDHKMMGKMPVATKVKVYSADGGNAGSVSYKDVKANTGLSETLFEIK